MTQDRSALHTSWYWPRVVPEFCDECGGRGPLLGWLRPWRPRWWRYNPTSPYYAVYRWQFAWGPLILGRGTSREEMRARIRVHNIVVQPMDRVHEPAIISNPKWPPCFL